MRSPDRWSIAVRRPDGTIHVSTHEVDSFLGRHPWLGRTVLRGVLALVEAVDVGARALQTAMRIGTGAELTRGQMLSTIGVLVVSVLVVFIAGPGVAAGAAPYGGAAAAVIEGVGRLAMFLLYLALVSRSPAARRLFAYHGAEHKAIVAFERLGRMPGLRDASASSPIHPRCGTNFLVLCVLVAGVVYAFVPRLPLWSGAAWRVALVPVVAVLAYEVMRSAARAPGALWSRAVTWPGRAAQRVTTREPERDQLEVALAALRSLVGAGPESPEAPIPP